MKGILVPTSKNLEKMRVELKSTSPIPVLQCKACSCTGACNCGACGHSCAYCRCSNSTRAKSEK